MSGTAQFTIVMFVLIGIPTIILVILSLKTAKKKGLSTGCLWIGVVFTGPIGAGIAYLYFLGSESESDISKLKAEGRQHSPRYLTKFKTVPFTTEYVMDRGSYYEYLQKYDLENVKHHEIDITNAKKGIRFALRYLLHATLFFIISFIIFGNIFEPSMAKWTSFIIPVIISTIIAVLGGYISAIQRTEEGLIQQVRKQELSRLRGINAKTDVKVVKDKDWNKFMEELKKKSL